MTVQATPLTPAARRMAVLRLRLEGQSVSAIAAHLGVSRARVYQLQREAVHLAESHEERAVRLAEERAAAARRREEILARTRAEQARKREEEERRRREESLHWRVAHLTPDWRSLNDFGWWLKHGPAEPTGWYGVPIFMGADPARRRAQEHLDDYWEDRANAHMTVLRLRRDILPVADRE